MLDSDNAFETDSKELLNHQQQNTHPQANHSINILTFEHPVTKKVFGFNFEKKDGYYPLRRREFPRELWTEFHNDIKETEQLYCNFSTNKGCDLQIEVDLSFSIHFAKHYYHYIIAQYFTGIADVVHSNFVNDVELWFVNPHKITDQYNVYEKYTLSVRHKTVSNLPELLVSHKGCSKVLKKDAFALLSDDANEDHFGKMICNGKLIVFDKEKLTYDDLQKCYPILNSKLALTIGLPEPEITLNRLKYRAFYDFVTNFKDNQLCTDEFLKLIPHSKEWHKISEVYRTAPETSLLQFKNGTHIDPYKGFKQYQPYYSAPIGQYRFFFIAHEKDKKLAKTFHKYCKKELGFIDFNYFINLPIKYDTDLHILYNDNITPIEAINAKFSENKLNPKINYLAIFISPYHKSDSNPEHKQLYYNVKKLLVENRISSQVIYKENLNKDAFKYYVSNIAVAVLAKLGGIPWCLKDKSNDELIIGIGAFKSKQFDQGYLGSTVCFSTDGHFNGFKCLPAGNPRLLAGSIKEAILQYKKNRGEAKRLVIHFYKQMSKREIEPIISKIKEIGNDMPIVIVSINKTESDDYVLFDNQYANVMPYSGSYIAIGRNDYILCNNTRYTPDTENSKNLRIKSYPLPIKLHLQSTEDNLLKNNDEVNKLIEQVYQFSRLYWKSVTHQNIPVTIKYPEILAEIFPHFQAPILTGFASKNLWFL